jgi:ABC-type antimicrobial peptide transport system permease subunit
MRGIEAVSLGQPPMYNGWSSSAYSYRQENKEPVNRQIFKKDVDTAYLRLYGMHLLAGRNLHPSDTPNEAVINETAMKDLGFASPEDALGKMITELSELGNPKIPVVGVVRDFHMQNFYTTIDPAILRSQKENLTTFNIKLDNDHVANWPETLKAIEAKWNAFYPPGTFSYDFYDETIEKMYKDERNLSLLINLATGISIFISCLGLFGLAVLTAWQRTKEIGIRKVLGASVGGLVTLLSRDYLRLVAVAIVIATPIAWWATNKWMQNFAYRTTIHWWLFAVAGASSIAIAFLTVGFHALKAARANPVKSLRTE